MVMNKPRNTLGDYFTLQRGTTYKSKLLGQPGPVLLGLASIQRNGGFRSDSLQTYGGESPDKLLVQPGDLYVSLKDVTQSADLLGAVARLPQGYCAGRLTQDTVKLEPKDSKVPLDYLYWVLRTPQYRSYCRAYATGTTNLGLGREDFLAFSVPEPTPRQFTLVDVLGALENKIELNRRMNETLEALARAIFKSWFVDFDPVRRNMARNHGRGEASPANPDKRRPQGDASPLQRGLHTPDAHADIDALFPDSFEDSELGKIPQGWRVVSVYECAKYVNGAAFRNDDFSTGRSGYPIVKIAELKEGISLHTQFTDKQFDSRYKINDGDILFSWSGSPDTSIDTFIWSRGPAWLNQHIFKVVPNCVDEKLYVYFLLRHLRPQFIEIARNKQTTGLGHVTVADLQRMMLPLPPGVLINAFNVVGVPLFEHIFNNLLESQTLSTLRNGLLPELLSGEMRVNEAERLITGIDNDQQTI